MTAYRTLNGLKVAEELASFVEQEALPGTGLEPDRFWVALADIVGRFGPGTPAVSDGAMLFLLHLVSKMRKPADGGSRMAIVLNGSPLVSGGAGGGESNIRQWLASLFHEAA